jgi:group I intron endonuclease
MSTQRVPLCGIYVIINTVNQKRYIGNSANIQVRWNYHKSHLARGAHENDHFQKAYNKYGVEKFEYCIIQECENDPYILDEFEKYYIAMYQTRNPQFGYNKTGGGRGCYAPAEESLKKMRSPRKNWVFTDEMRRKLSERMTGKKDTPEMIEKKRQRAIGNKWGLGKIPSEEKRRKISLAHKGNTYTRGKKHIFRDTSCEYVGVSLCKRKYSNKWSGEIGYEGGRIRLGLYDSPEFAAIAYNLKAIELYGESATLNAVENCTPEMEDEVRSLMIKRSRLNKNNKTMLATSKYIGVATSHKERGTWKARLTHEGKEISIAVFKSQEKAAIAYNIKATELFGDKAILNKNIDGYTIEMENEVREILNNKKPRPEKTSKYYGVSYIEKTELWRAGIWLDGWSLYIANFPDEISAAQAVNETLLDYYGYKANDLLNQISESELAALWQGCTDPTNELP